MTAVLSATDLWADTFASQPSASPWLQALRGAAYANFERRGFPSPHDEGWRQSRVAAIARTPFHPAPPATADATAVAQFTAGIRLVFVNGRLASRPALLPEGVEAGSAADEVERQVGKYASSENHPFVALNTAFLRETAWLRIAPGVAVEQPMHVVFLTVANGEPVVTHPRVLIQAGANSQCGVIETYYGVGNYLTNAVTEIAVGEGALVDHYKVQMESAAASHVATIEAQLGTNSVFSTHSISLGGAVARTETNATLAAGSEATINGLYLVSGTQHSENRVSIDHAEPDAHSHQLYKGVLDDRATAAFNGRILVRQNAQKTDAKQTNRNLLLSADAAVDTRPELKIFADDVRCTHGATIGQLDAESLFYLRSRGIGAVEARAHLTRAFAQDVIDRIKVKPLRDALESILAERFS